MKRCECGCGEPTTIAPQSMTSRGWIRGQPVRFRLGHWLRTVPDGPGRPGYKRGRWKHVQGYWAVSVNGVKRLEHDVVMEKIIGRPLMPGEVVHHLNEIQSDNRPENLRLMARSEHMRLHRLNWRKPPGMVIRQRGRTTKWKGCRVPNCERKHHSHDLCEAHGKFALRHGLPFESDLPPIRRRATS